MITYKIETDIAHFFDVATNIIIENNQDVDLFNAKLDISFEQYFQVFEAGLLKIFTMWKDEEIIGYSMFLVSKHGHHDFIQAKQDIVYVSKDHRGTGIPFMLWCEKELKKMDVRYIFRSVPEINDWSLILKRLNYSKVETIFMKDLKE